MKVLNARRRPLTLAAGLATVALAFGLSGAPAQAAPVSAPTAKRAAVYVALGDSYAAGTGGSASALPCFQSAGAYPTLLGGTNLGCFGATTSDIASIASASAALLAPATEVTITAGGNDVGSGAVAVACVPDPVGAACAAAVANAQAALAGVPASITGLVAHVRSLAPNADVVVTGYPRLFTITSTMTAGEQALAGTLNGMTDALNAAIETGADLAGADYVDVTSRFNGHGIGANNPWIKFDGNLLNPENFHPNAAGYNNGYRTAVNAALKR
jgi:lysophospholipase L1-like esterase